MDDRYADRSLVGLYCADLPLSNYSLTHSLTHSLTSFGGHNWLLIFQTKALPDKSHRYNKPSQSQIHNHVNFLSIMTQFEE